MPATQIVSLDGSEIRDRTEVWVAGFAFSAMADQGVWWRLFQSDFVNDQRVVKVFICSHVGKNELDTALSLVPPSEASRAYLVSDLNAVWRKAIRPEDEGQGFTAIIENGKIPLAMIGPPTEEAWEEFHSEWLLRT